MEFLLAKAPYWITRFGEIGIVLPQVGALCIWRTVVAGSLRPALAWLLPLGLAVLLTSLSKIAFIGWGVGIAALDFTGFSGHAMFSAATYPVLAYSLAVHGGRRPRGVWLATAAGYALALAIAWSRVHIEVHSVSEVVAGFALGAAASGWAVRYMHRRPSHTAQPHAQRWLQVGLLAWLVVMPLHAAPSRSHDMVTHLALALAAHENAFKRIDLHATPTAAPPTPTRF
jgi:membrane-associated phospholipid phosphatase